MFLNYFCKLKRPRRGHCDPRLADRDGQCSGPGAGQPITDRAAAVIRARGHGSDEPASVHVNRNQAGPCSQRQSHPVPSISPSGILARFCTRSPSAAAPSDRAQQETEHPRTVGLLPWDPEYNTDGWIDEPGPEVAFVL